MAVLLETSAGDVVIDLFTKQTPKTCLNFLKLCKIKYYNNALFYQVTRDYIAKCGHLDRDSSVFGVLEGEQSKFFEDELNPEVKHDRKGVVSMANRGPDMSASHFFVTMGPCNAELDQKHSVFGELGEGFEVLDKINQTICDSEGRPLQDIRIWHTYILEDPFEDPKGLQVPESPPPVTTSDRLLESDTLPGSMPELHQSIKENEAKTRSIVLEMLGDIPDSEIKPPDNVAFVCRLNKVTTDHDLFVIFSRFGPIKSCEVIKDWKTGESLQYAFIEFENPRDCEEAVLKMESVLIDDRRIHIDFSQSVAKLWRKYRRGQVKSTNTQMVFKKRPRSRER